MTLGSVQLPIVRIDLSKGRTPEQKRKLAEAMTEDFVRVLGVERDAVIVICNDLARTDQVKGGVPGAEWKR